MPRWPMLASHRSQFMWPWEEPPHSVASGILDDETYDWLAILRGVAAPARVWACCSPACNAEDMTS